MDQPRRHEPPRPGPSSQDTCCPASGDEHLSIVENNPFAFSPAHLSKLIEPKSVAVLRQLGGVPGLERGLRTDTRAGLSLDETTLHGTVPLPAGVSPAALRQLEQDAPCPLGSNATTPAPRAKRKRSHFRAHHHATASPQLQQLPLSILSQKPDDHYASRRLIFGSNLLPSRRSKSFLQLAWIALKDRVLILLSIAAAVSLALGLYQTFDGHHPPGEESGGARVEWIEGVAIMVAILVVVLVGALNDWQKERQFRRLNRKKEDRYVTVVRSGRMVKVSVYDVLVGDVVVLEQGDVIPVDGVLVQGHNVCCDESSSTGESDVVKKTPAEVVSRAFLQGADERVVAKMDPFLLSGSRVLDGVGTLLATAVGQHSSHGRTMMALRDDPGMTPLQARLNVLAGYIAKLGSAAGLLLFSVLFIEFAARLPENQASPEEKGQNFLRILITSITIIVVAVPEGLPLAVTLSLAFATKRMTRENNLVRHLQSCETMGNATVICSDKTGTLTENVMTVVGGRLGLNKVAIGNSSLDRAADHGPGDSAVMKESGVEQGVFTRASDHLSTTNPLSTIHPDFRELLTSSIAINTTAFEGEENGQTAFIGTKTETALLDWARRSLALGNLATERANQPVVQLFPFNSRWKCMATVIELPGKNNNMNPKKYRLLLKGAPEVVLARCTTAVIDPTSPLSLSTSPLLDADKETLSHLVSAYASQSLRTLALAYRDMDMDSYPPSPGGAHAHSTSSTCPDTCNSQVELELDAIFHSLTWLGVLAIQDPVRIGVPAAVRACHRASVAVKMVTGDKVETARAIARECGILTDSSSSSESSHDSGRQLVMSGAEFRRLSDVQMRSIVRDLRVLARSSPEDKRVLVVTLRALGEVVAVTGDGTNDAPALKAADVGFSMGIMGTEVAKEASDIILMDDNFSSIVNALAWGRAINDAIKKFLQFQITVNITAVVLTFVSAVASGEERSVLNAIQLLWVNLIMDTFAALALATDPPNTSLLDRAPEPRTAPLINLTMWKMILGQSVYQLAVGLTLHFGGPSFLSSYSEPERRTLVFNTFVFMQIFKLVNSRRIDNKLNIFEGLHRNHLFMLMMAVMVTGQVLIIFVGGAAFVVVRLNGVQWAISVVLGFMSIPVGILIRLVPDDWVWAGVRRLPGLPRWRRRKDAGDSIENAAVGRDLGSAMFSVRDDLAFLKRVRGGRIAALGGAIAIRHGPGEQTTEKSRCSLSPIRSAVGMPGLLAASIGAMSPVVQVPSPESHLEGEAEPGRPQVACVENK